MNLDKAAQTFRDFAAVIQALRTPGTGCPWDLEQDHRTLRPYLIEEAYEVLEAIDRGDDRSLREELGDLLLQVVLHAQVADDRGAFSIVEVIQGIQEKMVRRHPHVFGSVQVSSAEEVHRNWEEIKAAEGTGATGSRSPAESMAHLPEGLPALLRAQRLGEKAARAGFGDTAFAVVLNEVNEAMAALMEALKNVAEDRPTASAAESTRTLSDDLRNRIETQFGETLFRLCQLARCLGLNAEDSLRACTHRFLDEFRQTEEQNESQ